MFDTARRRRTTARPAPETIAMGGSVTPLRRHPDWIRSRLPSGPNYHDLKGLHARPEPQHGLRGGPLPEHRGVLGPADRDDHDPRRHLHPGLRLLRGQDRPADVVRRRRAAAGRRGGQPARPGARRRDERRPRRPAGRRVPDLRRDDPRDAGVEPGHGHRGPHPGLRRLRRPIADRDGRPARHPQPQPRDREAAPEARPQAGPMGSQPLRPSPGEGDVGRDRLRRLTRSRA